MCQCSVGGVAHSGVTRPSSHVTPVQLQSKATSVHPSLPASSVRSFKLLPVAQKKLTSPTQSCWLSDGGHSPFAHRSRVHSDEPAIRGSATPTTTVSK